MIAFNADKYVASPNLLFGRNAKGQELDTLVSMIENGQICLLLGERRHGKTSMLKCAEALLSERSPHIVPVYLDFTAAPIRNSNYDVYRYILAQSVSALWKKKKVQGPVELAGRGAIPSGDGWLSIYENLASQAEGREVGLQEALTRFILEAPQKYGIGFAYLFDEYEHLFKNSLNDPAGFYLFRGISQMPSEENPKPMAYVVAGHKGWEDLCSETGSAELNNLPVVPLRLRPLDYEHFAQMWEHLLNGAEAVPASLKDTQHIYDLAGGIPFYGKFIGGTLLLKNDITYQDLRSNFLRQLDNLSESDVSLLKNVLSDEFSQYEKHSLIDLINRGLLKKTPLGVDINGRLFKEFLVHHWIYNSPEPAVQEESPPRGNSIFSVFVSYAREDEAHKQEVDKALRKLVKAEKIKTWSAEDIKGGDDVQVAISRALDKADIILCLLSRNFIDSDYCMNDELIQALQNNYKKVVPVRLRQCDWEELEISERHPIPRNWIVRQGHNGDFVHDESLAEFSRDLRKVIDEF